MNFEDSIFKSTIRAFFKTFGGFIGFFAAIVAFCMLFMFIPKTPDVTGDQSRPVVQANAEGVKAILPNSSPVILRIPIRGFIGSKTLNTQTITTILGNSQGLAIEKGRVKGIILDIQSPGGTVTDSYNIFSAIMNYKKKYNVPVYAYVDGLCASGAMMIGCSADQIYSSPTGIIGSVGIIFGPLFNISELMERVGISQMTFTDGIGKDELSPFRKWEKGEGKTIQTIINYDYKFFVDLVVEHRTRMSKNALIHQYGAHVFDPETAFKHGYIDHSGASYNLTLRDLASASKIKDNKYQVLELKPEFSLSSLTQGCKSLLNKGSGKIKLELPLSSEFFIDNMGKPLYLYAPYLSE
ncbi:peptidase [Candidatus Aerophobetes bacterium]|uniref:Peptidase n=1 Tax=Aerophobetes bacterium TaxID=2030807 RepID=A0A2A4X054_UNCAE|nr:MAG: peptidase [Candidatus Aerophobetes bacterium]